MSEIKSSDVVFFFGAGASAPFGIPTMKQFVTDFNLNIDISSEKPAELKIGSPLNNTVKVRRKGSTLELDYQLIGSGGEIYRQQVSNSKNPPTFTIYKGNRKITSGSFRYG